MQRITQDAETERYKRTMDAFEKFVDGERISARRFTAPIGESCDTATLLVGKQKVVELDVAGKEQIYKDEIPQISAEQTYRVSISELDKLNKTCKVSFEGEKEEHRILAKIADPDLNPYIDAFSRGQRISVRAKAELKDDGDVGKLHILNLAPSPVTKIK